MRRPINLAHLSPLRRGVVVGYRRARAKARQELRNAAHQWEAELALLQADLTGIATELYRERVERAVDEALVEKSQHPGLLLN